MAFTPRYDYCKGCGHWKYFGGFYGCFKFKVYRFDEFDRLCGGRYHTSGTVSRQQMVMTINNVSNQNNSQSILIARNQENKKQTFDAMVTGKNNSQYRARRSDELSKLAGADRFVIVDTTSGDVVDKANGGGYHSMPAAYKGWAYKQKLRAKKAATNNAVSGNVSNRSTTPGTTNNRSKFFSTNKHIKKSIKQQNNQSTLFNM